MYAIALIISEINKDNWEEAHHIASFCMTKEEIKPEVLKIIKQLYPTLLVIEAKRENLLKIVEVNGVRTIIDFKGNEFKIPKPAVSGWFWFAYGVAITSFLLTFFVLLSQSI